ncbi:hypothetical protein AAHE18_02G167100 [Arachis hypogaea]
MSLQNTAIACLYFTITTVISCAHPNNSKHQHQHPVTKAMLLQINHNHMNHNVFSTVGREPLHYNNVLEGESPITII